MGWDSGRGCEEGREVEGSRTAAAQVPSIMVRRGGQICYLHLLPAQTFIPSPLLTLSMTLLATCPQRLLL